jgi:hypothetical protein
VTKNKSLYGRLFNANMSVSLDGSFATNRQFIKVSSDRAKLDIVELESYKAPERPRDVEFAERIAIGVMTLETWNREKPEREYIKLG